MSFRKKLQLHGSISEETPQHQPHSIEAKQQTFEVADQRVSWKDARSTQEAEAESESIHFQEDSEPESDARFYSFVPAGSTGSARADKLFKVIIIGDPTVGKTSFVQRYVQNSHRRDYKGTVGVDFALKIIKWSETQTVKLQLWDIAGQERFTWMTRVYYKDAHGCIIMFDLTNKNSFSNSLKWKRDVDSKCSLPDGRPIPCMLLANKCDLAHRQVDLFEVEAFQKEHNFIGWTEISAKEGLMVNDSMRFLVDVMMRGDETTSANTEDNLSKTIILSSGSHAKSKSKCGPC